MVLFKNRCRHCGGDMYLEEDVGFTELVCLQCGHRITAPPRAVRPRRQRSHVGAGSRRIESREASGARREGGRL